MRHLIALISAVVVASQFGCADYGGMTFEQSQPAAKPATDSPTAGGADAGLNAAGPEFSEYEFITTTGVREIVVESIMPGRTPVAKVNGKLVRVGDMVTNGKHRVIGITEQSVEFAVDEATVVVGLDGSIEVYGIRLTQRDFDVVVREMDAVAFDQVRDMGVPVAFDQVFAELQSIPRFKDEFETTAQFEQRQAVALAAASERYLVEAPVDLEHVRYDADRQVLVVATYALTNTVAASDELGAAFGHGSELSEANVEVTYSSSNIVWAFPHEQEAEEAALERVERDVDGSDFVIPWRIARGVFERQAAYEENVWVSGRQHYAKGSSPIAFEIEADPATARNLKMQGLRAAILVAPAEPFYATGAVHSVHHTAIEEVYAARIDLLTEIRYIIGDIQCAAIYDSEGKLLATRATR